MAERRSERSSETKASPSDRDIAGLVREIAESIPGRSLSESQNAELLIPILLGMQKKVDELERRGNDRAEMEASVNLRDGARLKWASARGWTAADRLLVAFIVIILSVTVLLLAVIPKLGDPTWISGVRFLFGKPPG